MKSKQENILLRPSEWIVVADTLIRRASIMSKSKNTGTMNSVDAALQTAEKEWALLEYKSRAWKHTGYTAVPPSADYIYDRRLEAIKNRIRETSDQPLIETKNMASTFADLLIECRDVSETYESLESDKHITVAVSLALLDALQRNNKINEVLNRIPRSTSPKPICAENGSCIRDSVWPSEILYGMDSLVRNTFTCNEKESLFLNKNAVKGCLTESGKTIANFVDMLPEEDVNKAVNAFTDLLQSIRRAYTSITDYRLKYVRKTMTALREAKHGVWAAGNRDYEVARNSLQTLGFNPSDTCLIQFTDDVLDEVYKMQYFATRATYDSYMLQRAGDYARNPRAIDAIGEAALQYIGDIRICDPYQVFLGWYILMLRNDDRVWNTVSATGALNTASFALPWVTFLQNERAAYSYICSCNITEVVQEPCVQMHCDDDACVEDADGGVLVSSQCAGDEAEGEEIARSDDGDCSYTSVKRVLPSGDSVTIDCCKEKRETLSEFVDRFAVYNAYDDTCSDKTVSGEYVPYDVNHLFLNMTNVLPPRDIYAEEELSEFLKYMDSPREVYMAMLIANVLKAGHQTHAISYNILTVAQNNDTNDATGATAKATDTQEDLKQQLEKLKAENASLRSSLHASESEMAQVRASYDELKETAEQDRRELADLRTSLYEMESDEEDDSGAAPNKLEFPYHTTAKIIVCGGHDVWLRNIKNMLPDVRFLGANCLPDANLIAAADEIWVMSSHISHKIFSPLINMVRRCGKSIHYFTYTGAQKCAEQLASAQGDIR